MSAISSTEGEISLGPVFEMRWKTGRLQRLSAAFLRSKCPCENCRMASVKLEPALFSGITIDKLDFVGNYALQLQFSDGHKHGAFSYVLLEKLPDNA